MIPQVPTPSPSRRERPWCSTSHGPSAEAGEQQHRRAGAEQHEAAEELRQARRRAAAASREPRRSRSHGRTDYDQAMPDRLYFTESDDANALIAADPMALLVGFALDQQVTVQKAFSGPLALRERLGTLDAGDARRRRPRRGLPREAGDPPLPRLDGAARARARRAHRRRATAATRRASGATPATTAARCARTCCALPGFGEMKVGLARVGAGEAVRRRRGAAARAAAPDARRHRLAAGARSTTRRPSGRTRRSGRRRAAPRPRSGQGAARDGPPPAGRRVRAPRGRLAAGSGRSPRGRPRSAGPRSRRRPRPRRSTG